MNRFFSTLLSLSLLASSLPASAQNVVIGAVAGSAAPSGAAGAGVPKIELSVSPAAQVSSLSVGPSLSAAALGVTPAGTLALGAAAPTAVAVGSQAQAQLAAARTAASANAPAKGGARDKTGLKVSPIATLATMDKEQSRPGRPADAASVTSLGMRSFDGAGARLGRRDNAGPLFGPAFEPPTAPLPEPERPATGDEESAQEKKLLQISFPPAFKSGVLSYAPGSSINARIRRIRSFPGYTPHWEKFTPGTEINVVSKTENLLGRPTIVTFAETKAIKDLTLEDFRGTQPDVKLKGGVRALRAGLIADLEQERAAFNSSDPLVTPNTKVRVIRFKSYLNLYRETHGPDSVPEPAKPELRAPLAIDVNHPDLKPLSSFLPRAIYIDVDALEAPLTPQQLTDMAKLQRAGVYFVAVSRKPYAAPGGVKDKLIRNMSSYQLSIQMPNRFLMATDDGAVIAELPRGGNVVPVDVAAFSDSEMAVLRDAAQKAAEEAGLSPRAVKEQAQPRIDDYVDEVAGLTRKPRRVPLQPNVRLEVAFPKSATAGQFAAWKAAFETRAAAQGMAPRLEIVRGADGVTRATAQKTDLAGAMPRLRAALGDTFGTYLNPGDALVLTGDPALMAANPNALDIAGISKLSGAALFENTLGLLLGDHREDQAGDLAGSASRMASFTRDRFRYLTESLVEQDKEEQNINFFSGHVVHAANDWLIYELQNGRRPAKDEYEAHLRHHWNQGLLETKPVGLPPGETMEGWLRESAARGRGMYDFIAAAFDRGETVIGTEIPNFFMLKDYQRRSGEVKRRYVLHTIFDFIALRPDPKNPGQAKLVIYDFKTGPGKNRQKLNKDLQVLTYSLFATERWVGKDFPAPYVVGPKKYRVTDVSVEFIYNAVKQITTVTARDRDKVRAKIISVLNSIHAEEAKMLGLTPAKPAKAKKPAAKKTAATKKPAATPKKKTT